MKPEILALSALENAEIGAFAINMQTDEMEYTKTFARLLTGDESSEFIRADFTGRVLSGDKFLRQAAYAEMLRTGKFHYEPRVFWKDNSEHRLRADGSCTFDETGNPLLFTGIVKDITNEKNNDQIKREWETQFSNMIAQSPIATALVRGKNLLIEIINQHMLLLVGKEHSIVGKPLKEALPENEADEYVEIISRVLKTGEPVYGNEMLAKLDKARNEPLFVNYVFSPFKNKYGEVDGVLVTVNEVTSQVKARLALEKSEEKSIQLIKQLEESELFSRNIIYNSPVAKLVLTGKNLIVTTINENMLEILGRDASAIGKPITEVMSELVGTSVIEKLYHVLATGDTYYQPEEKIELIRYGKPYIGYYNYIYKALHDTEGNNYGIIVTATEVTGQVIARQKVEEADNSLRGAIELANLGTWEVDIATSTFIFSERMREWFGFEPDKIITPESAIGSIIEEDREAMTNAFEHAISRGTNNIYDVEYTLDGERTGKKRILHAMGKAYFNAKGEAYKISGTVQDVTAQRTLQLALEQEVQERTEELQAVNEEIMVTNEELAQLNQNLIYSNDELQQFAHVASHDLKEPLRKIKTFIDRIEIDKENTLSEKSRTFMSKVHAATNRMFSMIEGVLSYSTINASEQQHEKINLNNIIKDIMVDLEILIAQKKASIKFENLPVIEGAPILIYQLFYNLVSNSLKFSKPGELPLITIESDYVQKGEFLFAQIQITDNGIGFEQAESEKIFNTFTRLNSKDQFEGTGLGLSLCKKIVVRHGGTIFATGKKNEGSVFIITLPVRQSF